MALTPVHNTSIWTPGGSKDVRQLAAARAVQEYDGDLRLGQFRDNGEWVVFMRMGEGQFPVLGLGFDLPTPERIKERLYKADTKRHGGRIADDVVKRNEARKAALRKRASEATGALVEAYDWALRAKGVHPFPRVFVPRGV